MFEEQIRRLLYDSISVKEKILMDKNLVELISKITEEIIQAFRRGNKVLLCGNGGSAADAQHIAAELSGKFYIDREPLFVEALHTNTSYLTAVANDYSYEEVFARLIKAKGTQGDIIMAISTSGNSPNIIRAVEVANSMGLITVGLTGSKGGKMSGICRYLLKVPSDLTPRIQEAHITIGHIICELVERELFSAK